jgi:thioredoxin-dependent peroxiredoxin
MLLSFQSRWFAYLGAAFLAASCTLADATAAAPAAGDTAQNFSLTGLNGQSIQLSSLTKQGPVVLVVLRGNPGYHCPACNAQIGQFLARANDFKAAKAQVVFVYPGKASGLKQHASEALQGKDFPPHFSLALDPDYEFTRAYGLRWEAKNETAYPATVVIDSSGQIQFAKISKSHGGRVSPDEALQALAGK